MIIQPLISDDARDDGMVARAINFFAASPIADAPALAGNFSFLRSLLEHAFARPGDFARGDVADGIVGRAARYMAAVPLHDRAELTATTGFVERLLFHALTGHLYPGEHAANGHHIGIGE